MIEQKELIQDKSYDDSDPAIAEIFQNTEQDRCKTNPQRFHADEKDNPLLKHDLRNGISLFAASLQEVQSKRTIQKV